MADVKLISTEIEDLNEKNEPATLGRIMVIARATVNGEEVTIGYEVSNTMDIGAVDTELKIDEIGPDGDYDYSDFGEITEAAQKVFDEYISKNYKTDEFNGLDANSTKNEVERI